MSAEEHDVDLLLDAPDDEFLDVVADDARGELERPLVEALRHDDVLDRWDEALTALYVRLNGQFAERKGDTSTETKVWRRKANTFLSGVLARKKECKALRAERNRDENKARWTVPAPVPTADTKEKRRVAGEIAVNRLCDLHPADFKRLLAEEYHRLGLPIKAHWLGEAS